MKNNFFKQVDLHKNNESVKIISVDLKNILNDLINEDDERCEIKFTFDLGDLFDKAKIELDEDVENKSTCLAIDLNSFKNLGYLKHNINNTFKKEKKKIERKKYQERKNKEKKNKVSIYETPEKTHYNQTKLKNPNPKQLKVDSLDCEQEQKFNNEEDEFVQSKQANKVIKRNEKSNNDCENIDINKWSSNHFLQYMGKKFNQAYGFNSLEFSSAGEKKYPTMLIISYLSNSFKISKFI